MSDIEFMISLLCYYMLCLIRELVLVNFYMLQYSYICSNMMSVHLKGRGSAWDISVSLTSVDMVSWLVKCCWMSPFPTVCRGSLHVVTALLSAIVLHVRLGDRRCIKCCDGKTVISVCHLYSSPLF